MVNPPLTTKAGKRRQRMEWTQQLNTDLMRCYYKVTEGDTITVGIRPLLHRAFTEIHPELTHLTEQRLIDQKRVIINNKRLSRELLEAIKQEVTFSLRPQEETQTENVNALQEEDLTTHAIGAPSSPPEPDTPQTVTRQGDYVNKIRDEFFRALSEFDGSDPTCRPSIPKQNSSKKLAIITNILDTEILSNYLEDQSAFEDIHNAVYAAAVAATRINGFKMPQYHRAIKNKDSIYPWERRLRNKVENHRKDIGRLTAFQKGHRGKKLQNHINLIIERNKIHASHNPHNQNLAEVMDTLKQKLSAVSKRLKRYKESNNRKASNKLFQNNEKQFYRRLQNNTNIVGKIKPSKQDIQEFWQTIWSDQESYNSNATWIQHIEHNVEQLRPMNDIALSLEDIKEVIKTSSNWKAAGIDHIHNFWYKRFKSTHSHLLRHLNGFLKNPDTLPGFMTQGITYLLPKDDSTENPAKYRPITCLPAVYKILTSCIAMKIYEHCENNNILASEQKGCIKNSQGCKEQLLIDAVITEQAMQNKRNLYTAYIDYQKAFDSVPHSWILKVLQIYKVPHQLIGLMKHLMSRWATRLTLSHTDGIITTDLIQIRRGIFQGDSLSPLLFCLSLNPLSHLLNANGHGFAIKKQTEVLTKVSHLMYMDDIKLYATTATHVNSLLKTVEIFSRDINMKFGLEKCKTQTITRGKHSVNNFQLEDGKIIESMSERETYKYLGTLQSIRTQHKHVKQEIESTYMNRLVSILKSKLNGRNTIKAINTYAVPVLTYTFGVIKWTDTDITNLERKTRTTLSKFRIHHPKSAKERLTLPRASGGRGLIDVTFLYRNQINNLQKYFSKKAESSQLHRAVLLADIGYTPLNLHSATNQHTAVTKMERVTSQINQWKTKALHGRHPQELEAENVDKEASNYWLTRGELFPETEGFLIAIQDQVIATKNYLKYIIRDESIADDTCRRCLRAPETIQHITAGCQTLSSTEYLHRHNCAGKIIHLKLAQLHKLTSDKKPYYEYTPENILENDTARLYWDRTVLTDKAIPSNRPDIILQNKTERKTFLIDIAIPNSKNLQETIQNKIAKYTDLAHEVKEQWRQNSVVIVPVVLSSTGLVPKALAKSLETLGLPISLIGDLQKSVVLNTCNIVRKFLNHA